MTIRTRPPALSPQEMLRAAEMYRDGKSRRQVAAAMRCSETAVTTALRTFGMKLREQRRAAAEHNRSRAGYYRKTQRVASVFDLAQI
jgi:DNA-binding NarL/FixJ family response regulator